MPTLFLATALAVVLVFAPAAAPQYRKGSPHGFAVLRYSGSGTGLPTGAVLQPVDANNRKWGVAEFMSVRRRACPDRTAAAQQTCLSCHNARPPGRLRAVAHCWPAVPCRRAWALDAALAQPPPPVGEEQISKPWKDQA